MKGRGLGGEWRAGLARGGPGGTPHSKRAGKGMNCGEVTDVRQWDLLRLRDIRPPRQERARYGEPALRAAQMRESNGALRSRVFSLA